MRGGMRGMKGKQGGKANQGGAKKGGIASAMKGSLAAAKAPPVSPNRKSVKAATKMMQDPKS